MVGQVPASPFVNLSDMRIFSKLLTAAALWVSVSIAALAQNPTTTFPYLYDNFIEGSVVMDTGARETRQMNIHLRKGALHYIDKSVVREAFLKDVVAVEIGADIFIPSSGVMYKVVAKNENGCVAEQNLGDFQAAIASEGAYGTSSTTAATMKLTSVQADSQVNQNYMNILNEKDLGMSLPVVTTKWIITPKYTVKATKKEVTALVPGERLQEWKDFQKSSKIKWKDNVSLLKVVDFLGTL